MKPPHTADSFLGLDGSLKAPLIFSSLLHVALFVITAIGLPVIAKDPPIINPPITIEIVERAEITQTPKPAPPKPKAPTPPKQTIEDTPPDIIPPEPEPAPEPEPEPPKEEIIPEAIPDPVKEPEKPKDGPKKDTKKPDPKATKIEKPKPKKDFSSLLKNLTPDVEETPDKPVEDIRTLDDVVDDAQDAPLGTKITSSELDALRYQLGQCWNVLAGAKYAEELIVEIRLKINRDRTVNHATILNKSRYNRDPAYRAAAESALRALRNPRCSPLNLPPEKYEQWKSTIITFDPREML